MFLERASFPDHHNLRFARSSAVCTMAAVVLGLLVVNWESASAEVFALPPANVDLIGELRVTAVRAEDTLVDIARRYDVGHDEMVLANPDVDRWLPPQGAQVVVPSRYILPNAPRKGIVLNVPEMRLYYFPPPQRGRERVVVTHPVSIGRMDWATPLGTTRIVAKLKEPTWYPPLSVKREAAARGESLPDSIPPGPDNPLGRYALRLDLPGYLIHGTNRPYGVGMRVTHGCIRLYPEDIERLFAEIPVGTRVHIVNQPVKAGWIDNTLFLEVHPPLEEIQGDEASLLRSALDAIHRANRYHHMIIKGSFIKDAVRQPWGIPITIPTRFRTPLQEARRQAHRKDPK